MLEERIVSEFLAAKWHSQAKVYREPDDADAQAALRLQIKLAMTADATLAEALEKFLAEATGKTTVTLKGNRSVGIGGNVKDSVIITGDRNKVRK